MALDLDGFETWRVIADHPRIFASLRAEASKAARTALSKLMRAKATALSDLRDIQSALGQDVFRLVVDGLKDSEAKSLVGRLDRHHPSQKAAGADWQRRHLCDLARGSADPTEKRPPAPRSRSSPRARKATTAPEPSGLSYVSAGATRKRRSRQQT